MFANWQEFVSPDLMHWSRSGELLIIVVLGGMTRLPGPCGGDCLSLARGDPAGSDASHGPVDCR